MPIVARLKVSCSIAWGKDRKRAMRSFQFNLPWRARPDRARGIDRSPRSTRTRIESRPRRRRRPVEVIEPWNEQTPRNLANGLPPAPWGYSRHGAPPKEHRPCRVGALTRGVARALSLHRAHPRFALRTVVATAATSDSLPSGNCVPNTANMIVPRDYVTKGEA